jgi:tetratricopeptide (TPR) repeat protein
MTGLDIDTRSDIYSLGVLLYELLTGRPPFGEEELLAAGLDEMRRTIREKDPLTPSTRLRTMLDAERTTAASRRQTDPVRLIHLVRGDLDWIVMRALEKDRNRRYETANALARDLEHYLKNEPVEARPAGKLYRFRKMARRNKVAFVSAGAVAAALVLGLGFSTWAFYRERQARARAETAEKLQRDLRQQAQLSEFGARALLSWNEGKLPEAETQYRQTLALCRTLLGDTHPQTASFLEGLATVLRDENKIDEALTLYQEALGIKQKASGSDPEKWKANLKRTAELIQGGKLSEAEQLLNESLPQSQVHLQSLELLRQQAEVAAQQGLWKEASLVYSRLVQLQPAEPKAYHALAALLVHTDDKDAYARHCGQALARFGGNTNPVEAAQIVRDCLLISATNIDLVAVSKLAGTALALGTNPLAGPDLNLAGGLAAYRQGSFAEAIQRADKALPSEEVPGRAAQAHLVKAMALGALNQTNQAMTSLSNAVRIVDAKLPGFEKGPLGSGWVEWIITHALLREARAFVEDKTLGW